MENKAKSRSFISQYEQLPVRPAAVDRMRFFSLHRLHGGKCLNANSGIFLQWWRNFPSNLWLNFLLCPTHIHTHSTSTLRDLWQILQRNSSSAIFHPWEWQLPSTKVGCEACAVTMASHFRQCTRSQDRICTEVTALNVNVLKPTAPVKDRNCLSKILSSIVAYKKIKT